jgi:hypothetical protein
MSSSPLFNPNSPFGKATTLDHFDLIEESADERETPVEGSPEEAGDPPPLVKRD